MVGASGGEMGVRGFVSAYDVDTGKLAWKTFTVPAPGERGSETWPKGDQWKTGGGSVWVTGNYDPDTNLAFWGTGNGGPWMGDQRPGDNLFTSSTIALDVATGEIKGHFQYHPNDSWDWDEVSPPILVDYTRGGKTIKGLIDVARDGYLWFLERTAGAINFVDGTPYVKQNVFRGLDSGGSGITPGDVDPCARCCATGTTVRRSARSPSCTTPARPRTRSSPTSCRIAAADNHVDVPPASTGDQRSASSSCAGWCPTSATTDTWACGPAGADRAGAGGVRRTTPRLRVEYFKTSTVDGRSTGAAEGDVPSTAPAGRPRTPAPACSSRPRRWASRPEYGCRMGICFSCVSTQDRGHRPQRRSPARSPRCPTRTIRICVSAPSATAPSTSETRDHPNRKESHD